MRLFIAIDISDAVRERIGEFARELARAARGVRVNWTKLENVHLTLKFLGHVEEGNVEVIQAALAEVAARHTPFDLDLIGAGGFPNPRIPRVLWIGAHDQSGTLYRLQADVEAAMSALGFAPEERAFTAHLTLGRIKNAVPNPKLAAALETTKAKSFGLTRVGEMHLIESHLQPMGAIYSTISSWKLASR